jgi:ATP-binding cassette subfamily B protein
LVESGSHQQLMANRKLYARLYDLNYASFDDIPETVLVGSHPESPNAT